jgi:hypothetical protein
VALEHEVGVYTSTPLYNAPRPTTTDGLTFVYRLDLVRPIPLEWSVSLGQIVHNLRSALDNAVYALALVHKGRSVSQSSFPIFTEASKYPTKGAPKVKALPEDARLLIESLQPFRSDSHVSNALRSVNALSNQDKHRIVQPWGFLIDQRGSDLIVASPSDAVIEFPQRVVQNEEELFRVRCEAPEASSPILDGSIQLTMAFDDPSAPGGEYDGELVGIHDAVAAVAYQLLAMLDSHSRGKR